MRADKDTFGGLLKAAGKYKYAALLLLLALLFILWPRKETKQTQAAPKAPDTAVCEEHLAQMLSSIEGCGRTKVMLTLRSSGGRTIAQSEDVTVLADGREDRRSEPVVLRSGSSEENVAVLSEEYPEYRGALVICEGGDNAQVKLEVIRAVGALTGLGTDKITVTKMTEGTK